MRHFYKALIKIGCLIFLSFQIKQTSQAQVTVNSAGNETICIGGNAITLDDILISESIDTDFQNTTGIESYELSVPSANFEFNTTATVIFNHTGAGTVTSTSVNITANTITFDYSLANTENGLDSFTISGVEVLAINTVDAGNIVRTGGTATQSGNEIPDSQIHASISSSNGATADAGTYATVCAGEAINLSGISGGMNGEVTWSAPSGNFNDINDLNAIYTPTITSGNVTLTLSIDPDGTGGCTPASDDATITVLAKPEAPIVSFESIYQVGETISSAPVVTSDDTNLEWHSDLSLSADISITSGNAASPNLVDLGFNTTVFNNTIVYVTNTIGGCRSEPTAVVLLVSDGVNVTEAPNAEKLCVGGNAINIGNIIITESDSYGFSNTQSQVSIELSSPSPKFEFFTGGGISVSQTQYGGTFSNLSVVATADKLTINYEITDTQDGIDELTISGVRILAIGNDGVGEILRTGGDAMISGLEISDAVSFATVKSFNTITVNAGSDVNVCAGETVLLQGSFDGAASSAVWSGPGTFADNTSLSTIYTPSSTTGGTIETLTLTSNDPDGVNGCDPVSATVNITIRNIPAAPTVNFTQNTCVGDVLTGPIVTSGNNNLKWHSSLALENDIVVTSGDPTSPNLSDLGFSSAASGSFQVYVTQTSPFGCESAPTIVRLTVNEVPSAPIITQPIVNICENDNTPISLSAIGDNLRWYRNDDSFIIQSNTFDPVTMGEINTATPGATTFKVAQVSNNCESAFSTITVEVQALPNTSAISGLNTVCASTQGIIYSVTEVANHTYTWNLSGGGTISSGQGTSSIAINWNSNTSGTANYTLSVIEEDETGCVDAQVDLNITVNPVPIVSFTGLAASYSSSDVNAYELTGTPTGGTFYGRGVSFNTTTSKYEFTPSEAGTGAIPIGYRFETAEGCIVDATPFVTNVGVPSASGISGLNASRTYCVNDGDVALSGTSVGPGGTFFFIPIPVYGELENDPAFPGNNNRAIFSPSKVGPGIYFLFYFNGFSFGSAEEVTVFDIPNAPTTENNLVYCQGDNIMPLSATGSGTIKWYTSAPSPGNDVVTATAGVATAAELGLSNATDNPTPIGTPINIWVTQTDGNGCESDPVVINISVIEKPATPVVSSTIPSYCNEDILQDIIVSGENGAIWEWSEAIDFSTSVGTNITNGVTSTFSNPIVLSSNGASSNIITYYVRQQVNGCYSDPQQIDITVFPTPNAPILSGIIPSYCPGDILQDITVNGTLGGVYEWSDTPDFSNLIGGITTIGNSSTFNYPIILNAPGDVVNTYKFYVRQSINGCYSPSTELEVTVNPTPDTPIVASARLNYCHGDILEDIIVAGENGANWEWSNAADFSTTVGTNSTSGNTSTFQNPIVLTAFGPGANTVNYWVRQQVNGCYSAAEQISITVYPIPVAPTLNSTSLEYCSGNTIDPVTVSGAPGANFKWYNNPQLNDIDLVGNQATLSNPPIPNLNETQSPSVRSLWVVQEVNGCVSPALRVDFTIHPYPFIPIAIYQREYCIGDNINNIIVNGRPGATFTWYSQYDTIITPLNVQPTDPSNASAAELQIDNTVAGTYQYYITQTLNGCESEPREIEIIIHDIPPAPIAQSPDPICILQNVQNLTAEGETGAIFRWYTDASLNNLFNVGSDINPGLSNTSASETHFWVTQTLNNCESPATQVTVTIYDIPPLPTVTQPPTYCVGEQIDAINATGLNLRWYSDIGLTNQVGAGNSFASGVNNAVSSVSKFYVTQTFFSSNDFIGCTSSPVEVEITIYDLPVVSIADLNSAYCIDNEIENIRGIPAGGTFTGAGITNNDFDPAAAGVGSHIIKYFYQNLNGCLDSASQLVTVNPLPGVTFSQLEPSYCINDASFELNGFPEGGTFILNGNTMADVFRPNLIGVGDHEIIYTYTDANTCVNADTQYVTIFPAPEVAFEANDFCVGEPTNFIDGSEVNNGNIQAWQWDFNDGTESTLQNPTHVFDQIGFYKVGLSVFTDNNCSEYIENDIYIGAIPDVDFNWTNTCVNDEVRFENNSNVEGENLIDWLWEFGDGNVSNEFSPNHDYTASGIYQVSLTVFSETNCVATITKDVVIFPSIDNYPYADNFENTSSGWFSSGSNNSWEIAEPSGTVIQPITPSSQSWITNADGDYNNEEQSYVESPCFDLTFIERPKISFDMYYDTQEGFDGAVLQSSINDGQTWELVGSIGDPVNWFNTVSINGNPGGQSIYGWSGRNSSGWLRVSHVIDHLKDEASVRFRVAFGSDPSFNEGEGFAFDNFRIEEREKLVLLETFTNSSNNNDALINPASRDQINAYFEDIIPINYHTNFPGTDPLNRTNAADPSARALYYGVLNTPRTVIDGISYDPTDALPFWNAENLIERALEENTINIAVTLGAPNTETLDISVSAEALTAIEDEIAFQVVCVERNITEITGENGEDYFDWVVRKMLPDAAGTGFSEGIAENERISFNVSWKPENIFDPDNMVVIVFAQNNITKEIYNVVAVEPDYFPDIVSSIADKVFLNNSFPVLFPNPAKDILNIELDQNLNYNLDWELITVEGQTLKSGLITKGQKFQKVEVGLLPRGTYFINYHLNGEFVLAQKFVKL